MSETYFEQKNYNCAQCVLCVLCSKHKLRLSDETLSSALSFEGGFGIGGICGGLLGAMMFFGLVSETGDTKPETIRLLYDFADKRKSFNCSVLSSMLEGEGGCEALLSEIAELASVIYSTR